VIVMREFFEDVYDFVDAVYFGIRLALGFYH
jgi:hypothetical protein